MNNKQFYFILLIIQFLFAAEHDLKVDIYNTNDYPRNDTFEYLIGIMVEFSEDDNPETSGNGQFLDNQEDTDELFYINYPNIKRCDNDSKLVIDLPPHDSQYFSLQMESLRNYYDSISHGVIAFDVSMLETVYQLNKTMSEYATSDDQIGLLFADGLEIAGTEIESKLEELDVDYNEVLFVVFHAGLGQEASDDFDPTIYDIKSAYVDKEMLDDIPDEYLIIDNLIDGNDFTGGIVMPETLNWIFYDVIEDIQPTTFVAEDDLENLYCGMQFGMTGLFAHLLGYHYGFPIMANVDNGRTRIGRFGLMDQGFSNQNGIIPPRPNPWTRSNQTDNVYGWVEKENKTNDLLLDDNQSLEFDVSKVDVTNDEIIQFDISTDEYFLIENRRNVLTDESKSINCLIDYYRFYSSDCELDPALLEENAEYDVEEDEFVNLFDVIEHYSNLNENSSNNIFEIDETYHVVTKVENYDYGLPGSGILIWHVHEPDINDYLTGINNDLDDKAVSLEEGDSIEHMGHPDYDLFEDYSKGNNFDFWYDGNEAYQYINYQGYENENTSNSPILFNNSSIPNTRINDNQDSFYSFRIISEISDNMSFSASLDYSNTYGYDIEYIGDDLEVIGNSTEGCIFYKKNNEVYKRCSDQADNQLDDDDFEEGSMILEDLDDNSRVLVDNDNNYYLVENANYYINIDGNISNTSINSMGFYNDLNNSEEVEDALSLGDIDLDGFDEKLIIDNNQTLFCYNPNETLCEGFPIYGDFQDIPLIVDILGNDDILEIICKNESKISILSNKGDLLFSIPAYNYNSDIQIVPNWGNGNTAALVNGDRLFLFDEYNPEYSYWHNYKSLTSNYPEVSVPGPRQGILDEGNLGIDLDRTYNYPNPIEDGYTKFRSFVYDAEKISIKIYDASGLFIKTLQSNNLTQNEYNEIYWDASKVSSGLYFAEVRSDINQSKLIKVVVIK